MGLGSVGGRVGVAICQEFGFGWRHGNSPNFRGSFSELKRMVRRTAFGRLPAKIPGRHYGQCHKPVISVLQDD